MAFKKTMQTLAIPTSGRKKAKGIGSESVKVPQQWLLPVADSTKPFTPVIDHLAFERWQATYPTTHFLKLLSTLPLFMGGIVLQGLTNGALLDFTGWGVIAVTAVTAIFYSARAESAMNKRGKAMRRYAQAALDDWLLARYNLKIARTIDEPAGGLLLRRRMVGEKMIFKDEQGREFNLIQGTSGLYVEERQSDDYAPAGTMAALTSPVADVNLSDSLAGEAIALHAHTLELLSILDQRSLSTEGQHVIKRVREDLRQTLMINRELQEIGGANENSRRELAAVISALNDELDEVLEVERQLVRDGLSTQFGYVKGRRRHVSALQLPPAQADSKIEIQKEELA